MMGLKIHVACHPEGYFCKCFIQTEDLHIDKADMCSLGLFGNITTEEHQRRRYEDSLRAHYKSESQGGTAKARISKRQTR